MPDRPPLPSVVWLARHAETASPTLFHGAESDVELGEHGRRQALAAAAWFAEQRPTVVVSSAMIRARDTAAPIAAACGVPHHIEPLVHERRVGPLSRQPRDIADPIWEETVRQWQAGNLDYTPHPAMESFRQLRDRTLAAFEQVVSAFPGGRVAIICHGVVCKTLLVSLLEGKGPADWVSIGRVPNLAVSRLIPTGLGWQAEQLLEVPPPVEAVNAAHPTTPRKTEG